MTILVYGFDNLNRVTGYTFVKATSRDDMEIKRATARELGYAGTERAYAIVNRPGLKEDFYAARRSRNIADHYEFRDEVEREAIYALNK